jgi:exodeoxyribonuclease VII large subunit
VVVKGARMLAASSRAPLYHLEQHRKDLHQRAREIRAAERRGRATRADYQRRIAASVIERKRTAALEQVKGARLASAAVALDRARRALGERRAEKLRTHGAALRAHDPERTLERGYALLVDDAGEPLTTAAALREAHTFEARLADGRVRATTEEDE